MILVAAVALAASACDFATDPATRLAYDIEAGAELLGSPGGATFNIRHATPSKSGECTGPYRVQLDEVGALILWCEDAAGETLTIELERRGSRAVIADVH